MPLCGSGADVCSSALLFFAILGGWGTDLPLNPLSKFPKPAHFNRDKRSTSQVNTLRHKLRGAKRKHAELRGYAAASMKMSLVRALPTEQMVDWQSCGTPTPKADLAWMDHRSF